MTTASTFQTREIDLATAPPAAPRVPPGVVVVHAGARDGYQVALALEEAGMLESLVTDLYWPGDRGWARSLCSHLPRGLRAQLDRRTEPGLPASKIRSCAVSGFGTLLLDKLPRTPLALRRAMTRHADATLGRTAGVQARKSGAGLLSYSYYGHDAFIHYGRGGMLFQMHPHPASMRRILREELAAHPDCAASLRQEWELALPEADFQHLVSETAMASHFLAASSFTKSTLIENGVPGEAVRVVPYGVDAVRFTPDTARSSAADGKLRLLFVGRINQRKGIKYLLEALRLVNSQQVELTVCGRVVDDLSIFYRFENETNNQVVIRPDVSACELVDAYQSADLFVFPSVAEGFGQVLLESLACGLPILSTTHTAAPDLIESGRQGFVVDPRQPDQLAKRIEWALANRKSLLEMRREARVLAEQFTWQRFRGGVAAAVRDAMRSAQTSTEHNRRRADAV